MAKPKAVVCVQAYSFWFLVEVKPSMYILNVLALCYGGGISCESDQRLHPWTSSQINFEFLPYPHLVKGLLLLKSWVLGPLQI